VGLGRLAHADRYCGRLAPSATCYITESEDTYGQYGMGQGNLMQLAGVKSALSALRTPSRGHMQGAGTGDGKILGGTFIIDQDGIVQYAHYSDYAGNRPDFSEMLALVRAEKNEEVQSYVKTH
jgi:hypothetical protein